MPLPVGGSKTAVIVHSLRTGVAAVSSLLMARLAHLPEAYWAPITTLVITQSSLGAALAVSRQRFLGTLLGAALGGLIATYFPPRVWVFGVCVVLLGVLCALVRAGQAAYRFGGVALAIVLLVTSTAPAWRIAFDRFASVSIGIVVALLLAWIWPEPETKGASYALEKGR